jgi:type IV pilus assembly protein PilV
MNVSRQRGSSLVEVLVSMILIASGLMGIARLLLHDLTNARSALLRTQAITLLSDMADRIRANAGGKDAYDSASYGGTPAMQGCAPSDTGVGANCSTAQQAQDDLASWTAAVQRALPVGPAGPPTATVEYASGEPARYRLELSWQEPGEPLPFSALSEVLIEGAS